MNLLERSIEKNFFKHLKPNKVLILLGARRIGKTSFIQEIIKKLKEPVLLLNGEDADTLSILQKRSVTNYKRVMGNIKVLIIDEAQKIPEIGQILKLMVDELKGIKIIVTGSSMFDLSNLLGEPLTGRSYTFHMFPFAQSELSKQENLIQTKAHLEDRLIFGSYPELWQYSSADEKTKYLKELVNSYLLRDVVAFEGIRNSSKLLDLLRMIAFQIGKEVSSSELSNNLGISRTTVDKYLDLLSKVFVIYKVSAFSRNLRNEISKGNRWYFCDNGIRNILVSNMNPLSLRNDVGELWENYVLTERIKHQHYNNILVNNYFWRSYQQQEIDWIEEREGKLFTYELKWNVKRKARVPKTFSDSYPNSTFEVINQENYLDWIGG